jgi:arylsulfatase A-like enzyme
MRLFSAAPTPTHRRRARRHAAALAALLAFACGAPARDALPVTALLHLADRLDAARIATAAPPDEGGGERRWRFDQSRPEWRSVSDAERPGLAALARASVADGVRLELSSGRRPFGPMLIAGLAVPLGGSRLADWETVLVTARASDRFAGVTAGYNLDQEGAIPGFEKFVFSADEAPPIFNDGSVQTYAVPLRPRPGAPADAPLDDLGVFFGAPEPAAVDLVAVALVPRGAGYPEAHGTKAVARAGETRTALYARAPARLAWRLDLPPGARLDFGLAAEASAEVRFRVAVEPEGGARELVLDEPIAPGGAWRQRSVDLARFAGVAEVGLEAESAAPGAVAVWGAPVVSAPRPDRPGERPNVVFYVIDGAGADLMSVYGYNRRTTPFLERLAQEGVVFERAYANSTWTQSSTPSFMTSLHHSVLGGLRRGVHSCSVPQGATTMAERFRRGGFQTAVFTANPNAGRLVGLERGVDRMRDTESGPHSTSSLDLHDAFWRFRAESPGAPYWVHFQTTDVHEPNEPLPPFAHLYVSPAEREQLARWDELLVRAAGAEFGSTSIAAWYDLALARAGVPRQEYYRLRRGLYDETMAHQDHQLGRFVEELRRRGEWENTIFVVAADHGHPAGTFARFGRGEFEPPPEPWQGALFDAYATRVPLVFTWPARIRGGRRSVEPVSMIDVLPTLVELAGLPPPEVAQGRSLAPLLLGRPQELRPVVLDEFRYDEASGEMVGNLELVDGRWGASLEIGPVPPGGDPRLGRHAVPAGGRWAAHHPYFPEVPRLLLYDLWRDPFALRAVNAEQPELVERYTRRLVELWKAQRALAKRFESAAGDAALDPEQLRQLRALGYIQ